MTMSRVGRWSVPGESSVQVLDLDENKRIGVPISFVPIGRNGSALQVKLFGRNDGAAVFGGDSLIGSPLSTSNREFDFAASNGVFAAEAVIERRAVRGYG